MKNINIRKFKHICPSCQAKNKLVSRCKTLYCNARICINCSLNGLCIDCYTKSTKKSNIKSYFNDKYANGVKI